MREYYWIFHVLIALAILGRLVLSYIQHFQVRKTQNQARDAAERAKIAADQAQIEANKAREAAEKLRQARAAQATMQAAPPPAKKAPEKKPAPQVAGKVLAYHYDDILFQLATGAENNLNIKEPLSFSEHNGTLYLLQQKQLIGNLNAGQVTNMVREWIRGGDLVLAYVSSLPSNHTSAKVSVYFYRNF